MINLDNPDCSGNRFWVVSQFDNVLRDWATAVARLGISPVTFHALRHSHASALIASGLDVVAASRRLGHASPVAP